MGLRGGGSEEGLPPGTCFRQCDHGADEGTVKPVAQKSPKPIKIAVLGLENNSFWIPVKEGTMKAAEELAPLGCKVEWIDAGAQHTTDVFSKAVEAAMAEGYDAIATVAGDSGLVPYINKAVDAGIPVGTFNSETATANKRLFFVGADLYQQGLTAGKNMVQVLGGKGKVAVITGFFSVEAHELRRKGFEDEVAKEAPGITIVGRVENKDKADTAYSQAQDFMTANPDLERDLRDGGRPLRGGQGCPRRGQGRPGQDHLLRLRR